MYSSILIESGAKKITTVTYDLRDSDNTVPVISEVYLRSNNSKPDSEDDSDSDHDEPVVNTIDISELAYRVRYTYAEYETIKTTPPISKEVG